MLGLGTLLTDTLQDHHDRLVGCTLVLFCQNILISCHFFNLFFSLLFRMILICFSGRGLVVNGRRNIFLFNKLYWTVFGTFFGLGFLLFHISHLRGTFEDSPQAKICMLKTIGQREINVTFKRKAVSLFFVFLATTYNKLLSYKVHKYLSGICPNGRMGSIGKFRRNLIDFKDNSRYVYCWGLSFIADFSLGFLDISLKTRFWIGRLTSLILVWLVHGLVLPLCMETPWKSKKECVPASFYVHDPQLPFMYPPPSPVPPQSPLSGLLKASPTLNFSSTSSSDDTYKTPLESLTITQNAHQVWKTHIHSQTIEGDAALPRCLVSTKFIPEAEPSSSENCPEKSSLPPTPFQSSPFPRTQKFTKHVFQQEETCLPGVET